MEAIMDVSDEVKKVQTDTIKKDHQEPIEVNINQQVMVKLTESGIQILKDSYNEVTLKYHFDGHTNLFKTELWDFMKIFDPYLFMGCPLLFENNNVVILKD